MARPAHRPRKYSDQQIIDAIKESSGMCYVAAAKIGCSPKTIQRRLKGSPKVAEARDDERGKFVDICEMTLKELVYEKDLRAVLFALRTLGRDRGYGDKIMLADEGVRLELIEEIVTVPASTNANPPNSDSTR